MNWKLGAATVVGVMTVTAVPANAFVIDEGIRLGVDREDGTRVCETTVQRIHRRTLDSGERAVRIRGDHLCSRESLDQRDRVVVEIFGPKDRLRASGIKRLHAVDRWALALPLENARNLTVRVLVELGETGLEPGSPPQGEIVFDTPW